MRKENDHVPPPWGNDMEEALMAQGEAIRKKTISVPRRRWLSWCRSTTLRGLGLIIAIVLRLRWQSHAARLGLSETTRIDLSDKALRPLRVEP
jgi:hypothetical protein